ncbi:MAG: tetratricopeptide repeat protein [Candidatus Aminicenantales bacterium]
MVKKTAGITAAVLFAAACATLAPPVNPTIYLENPPAAITAGFTLDDRIAVDKVWTLLRYENADKAEKAILKLGEDHPFYWTGMGYVALLRNDLPSAEADFLGSLRVSPDAITSHLGLGQVYRRQGRREDALNSYLEVLKRDPENVFAGNEAEALKTSIVDDLIGQAEAAVRSGKTAGAKEAYLKALEYAPKLQTAHLALARIFAREKNYPSALFHLGVASENNPGDKAVLREYAETLYLMGQYSRSLDAFQRLEALDPADKSVIERLDTLKARLGVVELPEEYREIPDLAAVTKEDVAALIGAKFSDIWIETSARASIVVDISTSWARTFIAKVAAFGIMEVYSNHTFQPKKVMNRAEMAETVDHLIAFLNKKGRTIVAQIPAERIHLTDVPPDHPYAPPIIRAVSFQIMDIFPDRTFRPDQSVTGTEAIRILDLLAGLAKEQGK